MTYAEDPDFWDRQNLLDGIVPTIEALSDTDRDFAGVAVDARANRILVFRRVRDVDRDVAESVYREVVPAGVGLEFPQALLTAAERQAIMDSFLGFRGRLASRGYRLQTIGGGSADGPVEISYLRAPQPMTFEFLTGLGVTAKWPDDAVERGAVALDMLEEALARHWDRLGRATRG